MIWNCCHSNIEAQKKNTILHLLGYSTARGQLESRRKKKRHRHKWHKCNLCAWLLKIYPAIKFLAKQFLFPLKCHDSYQWNLRFTTSYSHKLWIWESNRQSQKTGLLPHKLNSSAFPICGATHTTAKIFTYSGQKSFSIYIGIQQ